MSLFAIGDTHLSFSTDKPMNIFGGWSDYESRLEKNWRLIVKDSDTVVIAGDVSWAMTLEQAVEDFRFLDSLPGTKLLMKGNHDYWWETKSKMDAFFAANDFKTLKILFNNAYAAGDFAVCGTRGWFFDCEKDEDKKVLLREAGRLKMSIAEAKKTGLEPAVFLHYPPVANDGSVCREIYDILVEEEIKLCFYGHLHGPSCRLAVNTTLDGVKFSLISADFLEFCPKLVKKQ